MTTALQQRLPLRLECRAPMLSLSATRAALGLDEDEVLMLIGRLIIYGLPWAWNIGSKHAQRREVRILSAAVRHYQAEIVTPQPKPFEIPESVALELVLGRPDGKPWLSTPKLCRLLTCGSDLIHDLIEEKELGLLRGTTFRRGPGGAALVTRASVEEFLKRRRI